MTRFRMRPLIAVNQNDEGAVYATIFFLGQYSNTLENEYWMQWKKSVQVCERNVSDPEVLRSRWM